MSEKQAFKRSIFIRYLSNDNYVMGFVMGEISKKSDVLDAGWTVEKSIKSIIFIGIITPEKFGKNT